MKALLLLPLFACSMHHLPVRPADSNASTLASATPPASVTLAPGFPRDEAPTPPPAGERVAKVPVALLGYETIAGPDVIPAQPPSAAYPAGTVFSAMYRAAYDKKEILHEAPYLYEWDVARGAVVREVTTPLGPRVETPPRIDFDGTHVVMLSQQHEWDAEKSWRRLDRYDRELRLLRSKRLAAGDAITLGSRGEVAISSAHAVELFDAAFHRKAKINADLAFGGVNTEQKVWHAGDSFYGVVRTNPVHVAVVRFDDRTLRERARSIELPLASEDSTASLSKADEHWVLLVDDQAHRVDTDLTVHRLGTIEYLAAPYAWYGERALSGAATLRGSSVHVRCTPHWVFGKPLFACADLDTVTMVRPVLQANWSPFHAPE